VALPMLQPGMNTGALAGGVASVRTGAVTELIHSLSDVRGPDDVRPSALRLAEFEQDSAARIRDVGLVTGQQPVRWHAVQNRAEIGKILRSSQFRNDDPNI
jgi:hypothetical protein